MSPFIRLLFALTLVAPGLSIMAAPQSKAVNIAAASDLKFALDEIAGAFQRESGQSVRISYGSSGNFKTQILQGAPFELFLSADEGFVVALHQAGKARNKGTLYAIGRIVLFAPRGSPLTVDAELKGLGSLIDGNKLRRFAIAHPGHAPYGRAAREALTKAGHWNRMQPQLVLGENVSQAAQFATTGGADGGIFAYSLALSPTISSLGTFVLLPDSAHAPLRQAMALMKQASPAAEAFFAYLQQPPARAIFKRYGFALPGEA